MAVFTVPSRIVKKFSAVIDQQFVKKSMYNTLEYQKKVAILFPTDCMDFAILYFKDLQ